MSMDKDYYIQFSAGSLVMPGTFKSLRFAISACVFLFCSSSAAEENISGGMAIKDEETQLAQWFQAKESEELPYEYSLSAGTRRENLKWSIGNSSVNYASELEWKNTLITQISMGGRADIGNGWFVRGRYDTGAVRSGDIRDSDYAGANRTGEYSRSYSKARGAIWDVSLGIGKRFHAYKTASSVSISPSLGMSIHQHDLVMYDGQQSIPFNTPLSGLENSYDTQWKSLWGGIELLAEWEEKVVLDAAIEYHRINYSAEANWNLRSDLAHPVSFRHGAKGNGTTFSVGLGYRFDHHLTLNLGYERLNGRTGAGYDQTFFSYGGSEIYTLNAVEWNYEAIFAGCIYQF